MLHFSILISFSASAPERKIAVVTFCIQQIKILNTIWGIFIHSCHCLPVLQVWIHLPSFCSSNYSICLSLSSTCMHHCVHVCVYLLPAVGVDSSRCTCFPFPLTGTFLLWYYSPSLIATLKCICLCVNLLVAPICLSSHWPAWKTYLPDPLSRTLCWKPNYAGIWELKAGPWGKVEGLTWI